MKQRLAIVCLCSGLTLSVIQPLEAQSPKSMALVGSWQLTFTPNRTMAGSAAASFQGLATFTSDGSVIETDATEVIPLMIAATSVVYGTPGHGIWQPGPAVGNLFIQFISLLVNPNETLYAKKTVTITGALDSTGNRFKGNYSFELVDRMGHVIATGSGTLTGQRIPHPFLP